VSGVLDCQTASLPVADVHTLHTLLMGGCVNSRVGLQVQCNGSA
jgi:hypothetical protein